MQMHARGPGAGWSWLKHGFTVLSREPGKILGAAVLFAICLLVPSLIQTVSKPEGEVKLILLAVFMLVGACVYPILTGGFMRMLDASRNERPVRVLTLFEPFRPGQGGGRLALFGFCMLLVYVAFIALLLTTTGRDMWSWFLHVLEQQPFGVSKHGLPPLPGGFALTFGLFTVFGLFYGGANAIGIGQVALRGQSSLSGFRDGIAGAFKNALPLLVLAICGLLALCALSLVAGIIIAIVMLLVGLVSHETGMLSGIMINVAAMLWLSTFMMGVNYAIWHDVANAESTGSTSVPAPNPER